MYYWTGGRGACGVVPSHRTGQQKTRSGDWRSESKRYAIASYKVRGGTLLSFLFIWVLPIFFRIFFYTLLTTLN